MRSSLLAALMTILGGAAVALGPDSATGDETKGGVEAKDEAKAVAAAEAKEPEEFVLPAGFKVRRRGDITVYCIKGKATGTRFQTESCYDKDRLRDYLLAREQNNRDFERSRGVCSSAGACGSQ